MAGKNFYYLKELKKEFDKRSIITYLIFRSVIIVCMVRQLIIGNIEAFFLCILSLLLMCIPLFFKKILRINLPVVIEISIVVFVFYAEILGEINNFYGHIPLWDTLLHTVNGFLFAAIGFGSIDLINTNSKRIQMNPFFVSAAALCFSMTIGVLWEFFECGADYFLKSDMQKDFIVSEISSVTLDPAKENNPITISNIAYTNLYNADGELIASIDGGYLDIGNLSAHDN